MARRDRSGNLTVAVVVSILVHAGVIGASLVDWPWGRKPQPIQVTPVTLMTSADLARLTAAQRASEAQAAQSEDPVPEPTPVAETPPPPPPAPAPTPKTSPAPSTKAAEKAPQPKAPASAGRGAPSSRGIDPAALAARLAAQAPRPPPTQGQKGPPRPATDTQARLSAEDARAASRSGLGSIRAKLIRIWNPICGVEGTANVRVGVRMFLNIDGTLARPAELIDYPEVKDISDPVVRAAAIRALNAVPRGAPYDSLPREDYAFWRVVELNFDAGRACR